MGAAGLLFQVAGALLALLIGLLGWAYVTDAALEAEVRKTSCAPIGSGGGNSVHVQTRVLGLDHTVTGLDPFECGILEPGNFVEYHLRTRRTVLYESEGGACVWDSARGPC